MDKRDFAKLEEKGLLPSEHLVDIDCIKTLHALANIEGAISQHWLEILSG